MNLLPEYTPEQQREREWHVAEMGAKQRKRVSTPRDHESYFVEEDDGEIFWPKVKWIITR